VSTEHTFTELSRKEKAVELLRWLAVMPAAWLGYRAVELVAGLVMLLARQVAWITPGAPDLLYYVQLVVFYAPKHAAFVVVGAKIAPRSRLATAAVLAAAAILLSLMRHILVQQNRGFINYTHFALETVGALAGAAYVVFSEKRDQRTPDPGRR
jgi:hypothetical protein